MHSSKKSAFLILVILAISSVSAVSWITPGEYAYIKALDTNSALRQDNPSIGPTGMQTACTPVGSDRTTVCCEGLTRCSDHRCMPSCDITSPPSPLVCVPSGSDRAGDCCQGLTRCPNHVCAQTCTTTPPACVPSGADRPGDCCQGLTRCPNHVCAQTCTTPTPACVPTGSDRAGDCCQGLTRCSDTICRSYCPVFHPVRSCELRMRINGFQRWISIPLNSTLGQLLCH